MRPLIAIYARVSTEEQAKHGFSIAAQIRECVSLAGDAETVIFADEGVSGETLRRPALEKLMRSIEAGDIDTVICLDPDRLSPQTPDQLLLTEEWDRRGVRLVFVNGDYAQNPPRGQPVLRPAAAISEFEKAKINERMCRGREGEGTAGQGAAGL